MATEVRIPKLGKTMEQGTVVNYSIKVGEKVSKGQVIFDIETDKATVEVESPADGFVRHILARPGQTLFVGEPVLILGGKDERIDADFINSLKAKAASVQVEPAAEPSAPVLAEPESVITSTAVATGKGRLGATVALSRLQRLTAQKMLQSKREIPCFYLTVRADVTELVALRTRLNKTGDVKVSYNDFIILAVARALEKFPIMTGRLVGDTIRLAEGINIGLAISVPDGVVAPVVKNVQGKELVQIALDCNGLIEKAGGKGLAPSDLEDGCITVSNLGPFGVESFIPIVVPGQCSVLGLGKITDSCVPNDEGFVVRKLMTMTLSVDHRITNGAYAGQFLDFIRKILEDTSNFQ